MLGRSYGVLYIINILTTSIFTLLFDVGLLVLGAWLLVSRAGAPEWLYVPAVLLGLGVGIFSSIKFILASMRSLERIEEDRESRKEETK